jgi:hypothetical protein
MIPLIIILIHFRVLKSPINNIEKKSLHFFQSELEYNCSRRTKSIIYKIMKTTKIASKSVDIHLDENFLVTHISTREAAEISVDQNRKTVLVETASDSVLYDFNGRSVDSRPDLVEKPKAPEAPKNSNPSPEEQIQKAYQAAMKQAEKMMGMPCIGGGMIIIG